MRVLSAGMDLTPKGNTDEDAYEEALDPHRLKGLGNEGREAVKEDMAVVMASLTERCFTAVLLHRKQTYARKARIIKANAIIRPKPKAALSPILKKWNPLSLKASSMCPSTWASNLESSCA